MTAPSTIEQILDLGRWAPSGDNTQPWRFEIINSHHVVVHGFDTRDHCVYDLDGHPSQISHGALLETISIAASAHGLVMRAERRTDMPDIHPTFDLRFVADATLAADPLIASITRRSVQRRPMSARRLTQPEKLALQASLGSFRVMWLEEFELRLRAARLMFNNAKLRLTMPEAYRVHRDIIQWQARYSEERVPDQALGVDPVTARVMRFVMANWERVEFFNRYLAGTWAPRIQMDFLPSLACAAHFLIVAPGAATKVDDFVSAGRALQRFWLTATDLGLVMQPEMTPVIFARYVRDGRRFSTLPVMHERAARLAAQFDALVGADAARRGVFMGRVGAGPAVGARSMRRPLSELMVRPSLPS